MKSLWLAALPLLGACAVNAELTESQEYYAGRAAAANVLNDYVLYEDEQVVSYVTDIGYTMARVSDRPETFRGYRFAILDTPEVNAYTAPGGFVFVTVGLLKLCENEDELAGVIAHELGHCVKRHPELEARAAMKASQWAEAASILSSVVKSVMNSDEWTNAMNLFEDVIKGLSKAWADGYGAEQELEADYVGAKLMARVGYDPNALKLMLSRLQHNDDKGWNSNKYPSTKERMTQVEKSIQENKLVGSVDPVRTARFKRFMARIKGGR
jgi:predicted Zn-dependent protease